jgi:kynurenine formamidase
MSRRITDLTYSICEGMTTFPVHWHPFVEVSLLGRHGIEGRETRKLVLGTHTGTHCDAPRHFVSGGQTVDQLSLEVLIGPAVVVDFSEIQPFGEVGVGDFERELGDLRPARIVMRFDWPKHWGTLQYYTDHPFISQGAAQWLVDNGVVLLAMDTPMPDNPKNGRGTELDSPVHKIMLGKGVILVEYLCNLDLLQQKEIELIVMPLKIAEGDGAPVRCVAIEGDGVVG